MSGRGTIKKTFDLGKYAIIKLKKANSHFEMIVDPLIMWKARTKMNELRAQNEEINQDNIESLLRENSIYFNDIFHVLNIFENVRKAIHASETELENLFGMTNEKKIATLFLLNGDVDWTQKQRTEWTEKKRKKIITIISRNCINPQTKKPHPPKRIEKAMEEAKVSIKIDQKAEEQVEDILKSIKRILPIRMDSIEMAIKVPSKYAAKSYNTIAKFAQIKKSEWQKDGSWVGLVSLPGGLQVEFNDQLNHDTHGRVQIKLQN